MNVGLRPLIDLAQAVEQGIEHLRLAFEEFLRREIELRVTAVLTAVTTAWDALKQGAMDVVTSIVNGFRAGIDSVIGFFNGLLERAKAIFASIVEGAKAVASAIAAVASGGGGAKAPGFAGGGHLRGPGSGTSDSMMIRASNGEFVQRTAAVRKYGLAFMHALNQGRISVGRIREIMGGIDTSGLAARISAPLMAGIPGYRNGGLVTEGVSGSGGHPLTLQIGGQSIGGMTASPDAARQLQRAAVGQALRSAGRKPSWFK